jgi:hypothetical protein
MQYKDYEIYVNNPTLQTSEQDDYSRGSIFQIGLISSLPPTAMFVINRARKYDGRKNILTALRDKQEKIRRGYGSVKDERVRHISEDIEHTQKQRDIIHEMDSIRALEADPNTPPDVIKARIDSLSKTQAELFREIDQNPYSIYVSEDSAKAARSRDIILNTAQYDWNRALAGESGPEALERIHQTAVLMEKRMISGGIHTPLEAKDLTTAGRRYFQMLNKTLTKATSQKNPGEMFTVEILGSRNGLYDFKVTFKKQLNHIRAGESVVLSAHQFMGEHVGITTGSFDGKLMDSFTAHDGLERRTVHQMGFKGGQRVIYLHSDTMFKAGGSANSFFRFMGRALQNQDQYKGPLVLDKIISQNRQHIASPEISKAFGEGNYSSLSGTQVLVQEQRYAPSEERMSSIAAARKVGYQERQIKDAYYYQRRQSARSFGTPGDKIAIALGDGTVVSTGYSVALSLSSASGVPKGTFQLVNPKDIVPGGSPFGQQPDKANIVTGTGTDFIFNRAKQERIKRFYEHRQMKKTAHKTNLSVMPSVDQTRYNFVAAKRMAVIQTELGALAKDAAFNTERTIIMLGKRNEEALGVSADQIKKLFRYGGNSFRDILNNPNIDPIEVHRTVIQLNDHDVIYHPSGDNGLPKITYSNKYKSGERGSVEAERMIKKIDEAKKKGQSFLVVDRKEAESIGVTIDKNRKLTSVPGDSSGKPKYLVFFEERTGMEGPTAGRRTFKFFDENNSMVAEEANKVAIKQTFQPTSTEDLIKLSDKMDTSQSAKAEFQRRIASGHIVNVSGETLIKKGFSIQAAESAFHQVLSEILKDELHDSERIFNEYGLVLADTYNNKRQSIHFFGETDRTKSVVKLANRLFAKIVLGRDLGNNEKFIDYISIRKNRKASDIGKVEFKYNQKAIAAMNNIEIDNKLLKAFQQGDAEQLKHMEKDIGKLLFDADFRRKKGEGFLFTTGGTKSEITGRYINSVAGGTEAGPLGKSTIAWLDIMAGMGTPEGHNIHSTFTSARLGQYLSDAGAKMNVFDVQSLTEFNPVLADHYRELQRASFQLNKSDSYYIAQINRKINSTAMARQSQQAIAMRKQFVERSGNQGLEDLSWKTMREIKGISPASDDIANKLYKPATNAHNLLDIVRVAHEKGIEPKDMQKYIETELGLDEFYFDNKKSIEMLQEFDKKNAPVANELFGTKNSNVKGIRLLEEVSMHTVSSGQGPVRSDFLLYEGINPNRLKTVSPEELMKRIEHLSIDQQQKIMRKWEARLRDPNSKYHMKMADDYTAAVIRMEVANNNIKYLKEMQKSGNLTPDMQGRLDTALNAMRGTIERNANFVQRYMEEKGGYGKVGADFKIAPQFSGNVSIEKTGDFAAAFPDMDWRTVIISKKHVQGMTQSSFIKGNLAKDSLHHPDIQRYFNAINMERVKKFKKDLRHEGTPYERLINSSFSEIEHSIDASSDNPAESVRAFAKRKYNAMHERLEKARVLSLEYHNNEADRLMIAEMQRLKGLEHVEQYKSLNQVRNLFSDGILYKKINSQLQHSDTPEIVSKIWKDLFGILEAHKIRNNKNYIDSGRLWAGWQSIGQRLQNKNELALIKKAIKLSVNRNDSEGRIKARRLANSLEKIAFQYTKSESQVLLPEYEKEFGKVAELMMVMDDIGVGNKDVQKVMGAKAAKPVNHSQLTNTIKVVNSQSRQLTDHFIESKMLLRRFEGMISFNTDREILKLLSPDMTDGELAKLADNKIAELLALSNEVIRKAKDSGHPAGEKVAKHIGEFINILGIDKDKTMFKTELMSAMKIIRSAGTEGLTGMGKVDPAIFTYKHHNGIVMKLVLDHHIDQLDSSKFNESQKGALKKSLKNGKIKVNEVLAFIMDRDFDGDAYNIYAAFMDERFGVKRGRLTASNVMSMMKNMSFSREGNSFLPTNASSAVMAEMLFNEQSGAHTIIFESAYDAAKRRLEKEAKNVGYLDTPKNGTFDFHAAMKDVINRFAVENHLDKKATDEEKLDFIKRQYVIKDVKGMAHDDVNEIRVIKVGDQEFQVGKKERSRMGIDSYSRKVAYDVGLDFSTNRKAFERMEANANAAKERHKSFLAVHSGKAEEMSIVERAIDAIKSTELKNQTKFETQKAATGDLYKYPTMFRMLGESMLTGNDPEVIKTGKMMKTLAELASYTFEQKLAIGMKKGGIDAVEGVHELFNDIFSIADISDEKIRNEKSKALYTRITERGLKVKLSGSEKEFAFRSGYYKFTGALEPSLTINFNEMLKLGYAKQHALEAIISGDHKELHNYLKETYNSKTGLNEFADGLIEATKQRAKEFHNASNSTLDVKNVYLKMLKDQFAENVELTKSNSNTIRMTEVGMHSFVGIAHRGKISDEFQEMKKLLKIIGSVSKDTSHQELLGERLRQMRRTAQTMGIKSTLTDRFFGFLENGQADMVTDIFYSDKQGFDIKYRGEHPKPQLISKNFGVKTAGIGLGVLALGAFAPSVTTGKSSSSVVDKTDEYSTVLPDKMIAQYNNQATVSQINPWVTNRIKEERAESARFNHMFYKSFTG